MKKRIGLAALLAALATAAMVALPAIGHRTPKPRVLFTAMAGAEEQPGPGDDNGYGAAYFEIVGNKICFRSEAEQLDGTTLFAHIHRAELGQEGPIVVTLFNGAVPEGRRCVKTTRSLAKEIGRFPGRFYANIHTTEHQAGAVRGQLRR